MSQSGQDPSQTSVNRAPTNQSNPLDLAESWHRQGRKVAIATVVATWGSSPRQAGSQLIVDDQGQMQGSVSGGCIEGAVVKQAIACMDGAPAQLMQFGVSNEQAWEIGLACGGNVEVFVEAINGAKT